MYEPFFIVVSIISIVTVVVHAFIICIIIMNIMTVVVASMIFLIIAVLVQAHGCLISGLRSEAPLYKCKALWATGCL